MTSEKPLKLVGHEIYSTCTQRVAIVCKEKGVPYEIQMIDFAAHEQKSPKHLEKHPFGQVPYLDDDGFILFESRAISRYVARKYADQGNQIIPSPDDLKATALFEQAASVEIVDFDAIVHPILEAMVFATYKGLPQSPDIGRAQLELLKPKIDGYERILSKQKYLAGDNITLADLFHLPNGNLLEGLGGEYKVLSDTSRPNVARWWADISERDSWKAVIGSK